MKLPAPPSDNKYRVLIVEDDPAIMKLVALHLNMAGFNCRQATNGANGWREFGEFDPHLVLSDISMSGLSGHELTAKIRSQSSVPVILMTAASSDDSEMLGFKTGADDYIPKPFNPKLLVARVVANLRRVYRYTPASEQTPARVGAGQAGATGNFNFSSMPDTAPVAPAAQTANGALPDEWSKCDKCGYMGPTFKFEGRDSAGTRVFICPHCKNRSVTFSVG